MCSRVGKYTALLLKLNVGTRLLNSDFDKDIGSALKKAYNIDDDAMHLARAAKNNSVQRNDWKIFI